MNEPKKQFIAGAVCPACEKMDTVRMWSVDGVPHRECVACGYADILNEHGQSVPVELGTRVNQVEAKPVEQTVQIAQFFPNPKLKKTED